jgi:hypothetical protein
VARSFRLASPTTATVLGALVFVLAVAAIPLVTLNGLNIGSDLLNLIFAGVGVLVARRQPRNPIGWILLIFIFMAILGDDAGAYAVLIYTNGHHGLPLGLVAVLLAASGLGNSTPFFAVRSAAGVMLREGHGYPVRPETGLGE